MGTRQLVVTFDVLSKIPNRHKNKSKLQSMPKSRTDRKKKIRISKVGRRINQNGERMQNGWYMSQSSGNQRWEQCPINSWPMLSEVN